MSHGMPIVSGVVVVSSRDHAVLQTRRRCAAEPLGGRVAVGAVGLVARRVEDRGALDDRLGERLARLVGRRDRGADVDAVLAGELPAGRRHELRRGERPVGRRAVAVGRDEHEVRVVAARALVDAVARGPHDIARQGGARADVVDAAVAEEDLALRRERAPGRDRHLDARGARRRPAAARAAARLGLLDRYGALHAIRRPVPADLRRRLTGFMWLGVGGARHRRAGRSLRTAGRRSCGAYARRVARRMMLVNFVTQPHHNVR